MKIRMETGKGQKGSWKRVNDKKNHTLASMSTLTSSAYGSSHAIMTPSKDETYVLISFGQGFHAEHCHRKFTFHIYFEVSARVSCSILFMIAGYAMIA